MADKGYTVRGDKVRYYRMRRMLTQRQLASRCDLSLTHLSRIENNKQPSPHFTTIHKLAEGLGVSPDDLLAWDDVEAPD